MAWKRTWAVMGKHSQEGCLSCPSSVHCLGQKLQAVVRLCIGWISRGGGFYPEKSFFLWTQQPLLYDQICGGKLGPHETIPLKASVCILERGLLFMKDSRVSFQVLVALALSLACCVTSGRLLSLSVLSSAKSCKVFVISSREF